MRVGLGVAATLVAAAVVSTAAAAAAAPPSGDPPGNPPGANGTIKIDALPFDDGMQNEPHVDCMFRVKFFNFDDPETATLVFTSQQQPLKGKDLLLPHPTAVIHTNGTVGPFSASQFDFTGITPQPNQGFHVKLTVTTDRGTTKHKVFWIKPCGTATPTPTTASPTPTTASPTPTTASPTATASRSTAPVPSGAVKAGGGGSAAGSLVWGLGALTAAGGTAVTLILARRRRENA